MTVSIRIEDAKLREMIRATKGKKPIRVVADGVEYGLYQELGTTKMDAQPFMVPAVEKVRPGFTEAFKGDEKFMQAEQIVEKAARDVERFAKQDAPVDTGALRGSIHVYEPNEIEFG